MSNAINYNKCIGKDLKNVTELLFLVLINGLNKVVLHFVLGFLCNSNQCDTKPPMTKICNLRLIQKAMQSLFLVLSYFDLIIDIVIKCHMYLLQILTV